MKGGNWDFFNEHLAGIAAPGQAGFIWQLGKAFVPL